MGSVVMDMQDYILYKIFDKIQDYQKENEVNVIVGALVIVMYAELYISVYFTLEHIISVFLMKR
jgi:hypothetical protein